jgi:tetratricopeptide (TPR) repeat protein
MKRLILGLALAALACSSARTVSIGDERFKANDFDGAVAAYEAALKESPQDAEIAQKLAAARRNSAVQRAAAAESALEAGKLDRAESEIRVALARDPSNERAQAASRRLATLRDEVVRQIGRAREAIDRSEPQAAYKILDSISRYGSSYPEIKILTDQVADRYCRELLQAADAFGRAGEWTRARATLEHAAEIAHRVPDLAPAVAAAQVDVRVLELMDQGLKLKSMDDLAGALNRFETAYKLKPSAPEVAAAYASARSALAATYVARAGEAAQASLPIQAYVWMAKAADIDPELAELKEIRAGVCRAAARAMMVRADEAFRKGQVGLEWVRVRQAKIIDPELPDIDKALRDATARLERAIRPAILVEKFQNATAHGGREIRLASEAYRTLQTIADRGRFATVLDEGSLKIHRQENADFVPEIVVRGTLERFEIVHHPDVSQNEMKEYYTENTYYDIFTGKETRVTEKRTHNYDVVTKKVTAVGRLVYEIYDTENKTALASGELDENYVKEDKVVQGNAQAGIPADPMEIPADAVIADELHNKIKSRLLNAIQADLGWTGKKLYAMYLKYRESDDTDAAVSYAVLACRSLIACGRRAMAEDLEFILKKTGFALQSEKLETDYIR